MGGSGASGDRSSARQGSSAAAAAASGRARDHVRCHVGRLLLRAARTRQNGTEKEKEQEEEAI